MILTETATATTIDASAPASFTCANCPFARLIEDNRYCCQVSQTASNVKRGHWEATVSCYEELAKAGAEKAEPVAEVKAAPIAAPKKLMLTLVAVKRITSDVAACNFDRNELEIAGSRASGDRWFCYSQAWWCETVTGTRLSAGIFSTTRRLWHGGSIRRPVKRFRRESKKPKIKRQASALLLMLKFVAPDAFAPSQQSDGAI